MIDGNEAMARSFTDGPEHPCPELEIEVRYLRAALAEAVRLLREAKERGIYGYTHRLPQNYDWCDFCDRIDALLKQHEEARHD